MFKIQGLQLEYEDKKNVAEANPMAVYLVGWKFLDV